MFEGISNNSVDLFEKKSSIGNRNINPLDTGKDCSYFNIVMCSRSIKYNNYIYYISLRFSNTSETNASEVLENLEEMLNVCYIVMTF